MSVKTIPLGVSEEFESELKQAAKRVQLSVADVIRQSAALGLPLLLERLGSKKERLINVDPLPRHVLQEAYSRPERDEEGIERLIDRQPKGVRD